MRFSYAANLLYGARDTAIMVASRWFRCIIIPLKLSAQKEQCGHPASQLESNMKWYTINWLLPSKSSGRVCFPLGPSKTYFLSTASHGSSRRCWLSSSRSCVNSFSFVRNSFRAESHTSCETTGWFLIPTAMSFFMRSPLLAMRALSTDDGQLSQQVGTVAQRFLQRLLPAPTADFLVVAAQQNLRHGPAAVFRRTGVMRKIEQAPRSDHVMRNQERLVHLRELLAEGFLDGRRLVPQRPRLQPRYRVHNQRRRQFAAGQHVIADGNFFGGEMLGDAFVHAFIPPAEQDDPFERRVSPRGLLPEKFPRRRKQNDRYVLRALWTLCVKFFFQQSLCRLEQRLGLQHHSFAAAKRTVVHGAVAVAREPAQIVHRDFHQAGLACPAHNPVVKRALEKLRENRDDVEAHGISLHLARKQSPRQPARHVPAILFVFCPKFPPQRGLFVEQDEQVRGEKEARGRLEQRQRMKQHGFSRQDRPDAPIYRVAHKPVRPLDNQSARRVKRRWRSPSESGEGPKSACDVKRCAAGDQWQPERSPAAQVCMPAARHQPIRHQDGPESGHENRENQRADDGSHSPRIHQALYSRFNSRKPSGSTTSICFAAVSMRVQISSARGIRSSPCGVSTARSGVPANCTSRTVPIFSGTGVARSKISQPMSSLM